ncbi:MAG: hypothetical protein ACREUE_04525, partial [Panacagrimonas sp.]
MTFVARTQSGVTLDVQK